MSEETLAGEPVSLPAVVAADGDTIAPPHAQATSEDAAGGDESIGTAMPPSSSTPLPADSAPIGHLPPQHDTAAASTHAQAEVEPASASPYVLPIDSLQAIAEGAGLQWVNSDAEKIRAAQAAIAAMPAPIRVPREIRRPVRVDEGPLVLVETRKDLAQVRLPFETQGPGA